MIRAPQLGPPSAAACPDSYQPGANTERHKTGGGAPNVGALSSISADF